MAAKELDAGMCWVERRFSKLASEVGVLGPLAPGDRWQVARPPLAADGRAHQMAYYVEVHGHVKRGEVAFRDRDLEGAGDGDRFARAKLDEKLRYLLRSFG